MIPALILFVITYALMLAFPKYRPAIALTSGAAFTLLGCLGLYDMGVADALAAIDLNVLLMISARWAL